MACGGCKGGGNRHNKNGGDLTKFAYLTPRQLRLLKEKEQPPEEPEEEEGEQG